jgi:hypothetical protein
MFENRTQPQLEVAHATNELPKRAKPARQWPWRRRWRQRRDNNRARWERRRWLMWCGALLAFVLAQWFLLS